MEAFSISTFLDILMVLLLAAVLAYGVRLNRNLSVVRSGREELQKLLQDFTSATERAEKALSELKSGTGAQAEVMAATTTKAQTIADDLEFLIRRGETLADGLEAAVKRGGAPRSPAGGMPRSSGSQLPDGPSLSMSTESEPRSETDSGEPSLDEKREQARAKSKSELLKALQGMR